MDAARVDRSRTARRHFMDIETVDFRDRRVGIYLDALASGTPTPGGGSAAGLAGALGCSLGLMVCKLTEMQSDAADLSEITGAFELMIKDLLDLAHRDEAVFAAYRAAVALPRGSNEEKASRRASIEHALVEAADVPFNMAEVGLEAIDGLRMTAAVGTRHALGDLMTGGYLLQAMILGSIENMQANASAMKTPEKKEHFLHAADSVRHNLETRMLALHQAVALRQQ